MRLGLIGGTDSKRTSGVYRPEDVVALQNARKYVTRFGYDGVSNALTGSGIEEAFDVSRDGRYVYVAVRGTRTTAAIFQYDCSTPWDLSTIAYSGKSLVVGNYDLNLNGVAVSDDGTKLIVSGYNSDTLWSCTLATPCDLATATFDVKSAYVGSQDATPNTPFFGDSGTKMYVLGATNDTVYQYTLSTAWDVSTASYANKSFSVTGQEATPQGLFFKNDGSAMYVVGTTNDTVYQYTLSTAWDVSTASYASKSFSINGQETVPRALFFKPDGTKMYALGQTGDSVNEYNLSTAWDVSTASFVHASAFVGEATPTGLWFKDDGSKMYVTGSTTDTVREFSLSTAWNVSTISFAGSQSVGFETSPSGVTFRSDGTKLYILGQANDCVYEIPLSTAWNISSARYYFYMGAVTRRGIWLSGDGLMLFAADANANRIYKYSLSVAFDPSAAALDANSLALTSAQSIHIEPDGLIAYATDNSGLRRVFQINMTTPFDLSTATVNEVERLGTYGVTGQSTSVWGVRVSPDLTKMWLLTDTVQGLHQFSLRFA